MRRMYVNANVPLIIVVHGETTSALGEQTSKVKEGSLI